jgi:MSHA biogenesis protein MshP
MRPDLFLQNEDNAVPGPRSLRAQGGFSIVAAIFLMVTLAALGAFMLTFSSTQSATSNQDLQGSRAYFAARAGIDYGLYQVLIPASPASCGSSTMLNLNGTLSDFHPTVSFACSGVFTEGTTTMRVYTITSLVTSGGTTTVGMPNFIERQLQATVSR